MKVGGSGGGGGGGGGGGDGGGGDEQQLNFWDSKFFSIWFSITWVQFDEWGVTSSVFDKKVFLQIKVNQSIVTNSSISFNQSRQLP